MLEIDILGELFEIMLRRNISEDPRFKDELTKKYIEEMGPQISFLFDIGFYNQKNKGDIITLNRTRIPQYTKAYDFKRYLMAFLFKPQDRNQLQQMYDIEWNHNVWLGKKHK